MLKALFGAAQLDGLAQALAGSQRWHGVSPEPSDRFAALAPEPALRRALTAERITAGRVRVLRNARAVPQEMLLERTPSGPRLSPEALNDLCAQGASLVLEHLDREFPAIGALSATLERCFGVKSWTNAYWSHGRDSAFKPHSDNHNVLILHVSGEKRWKFWGAVEPDPILSRPYDPAELPEPAAELSLGPGDMLFVPRGDVHCAQLATRSSLHLTIALDRWRVDHLLDGLRAHLGGSAATRADLPADPAEADAAARVRIRDLLDLLPPGALSRGFVQTLVPRTVINLGIVRAAGTLLVPVLRSQPAVAAEAGGGVQLVSGAFRVSLTGAEWAVLERALDDARALHFGDLDETLQPAAAQLVGRGLLYALAPSEWRAAGGVA